MSSHKTLIDGTSRTLSGGGCIINGTNYKISSGNTLIDGKTKKIEFGAPKTWILGDFNITDVSEFDTDGDDKLEFYAKFYTPNVNDYSYFGMNAGKNSFEVLQMYYKNWEDGFCITYVEKSRHVLNVSTGEYILMPNGTYCNVYKAGGAHWNVFNNASRTITFYESPTGILLALLQKTSTSVY